MFHLSIYFTLKCDIKRKHQFTEMQHELEEGIHHLQRTIYELQNKKHSLLLKFKQLLDEEVEIARRYYMEKTRFVRQLKYRVKYRVQQSQNCNDTSTFQCLFGILNRKKNIEISTSHKPIHAHVSKEFPLFILILNLILFTESRVTHLI